MSKNSKIDQTVNIGKENIDMSMKFSGEMCLMIILKITKKQDFSLPLQSTVLKKIQGEGGGGGSNWVEHIQKKGEQEWVYTIDCLLALFAIFDEVFYQSFPKDFTVIYKEPSWYLPAKLTIEALEEGVYTLLKCFHFWL